MITRARTLVSGLAALVVLVLIVVGLPALLYRFGGSPVPRHLPGWRRIAVLLSSRDDGTLLLAAIRDGAWLAWLLFTACVLAEAQAAMRGSRVPRLRLGGVQGTAAQLVALVTLALATPSAMTLSASVTAAAHQNSPAPDSAESFVTVRSGDCLWSLAEHYLGAGDRYPEIARLNYGRPMGDGEIFTNPSFILPGWRLVLPNDAVGSDPGPAAVQPAISQHPGHATSDSHYRRRHPVAPTRSAAGQTPASHAGNGLALPGPGSSARVAEAASPRSAAGQAGGHTAASAAAVSDRLAEPAVFVTGALAGAILTSLTRLRFQQRQQRRRGRRIRLPASVSVLAAEQGMRVAAPGEPVRTLHDALACLEARLQAAGHELPDVVGVHITPGLLEILLAAPAVTAPPTPYEVSPGRQGMCWQLALPAFADRLASPGSQSCHFLPGLVSIGATADGYLLLDLESLQVTGVDGPADLAARVIATVATELATGQWSGWYDLILVGCDELAPLGRAQHYATLDEALSVLEPRCAITAQRIAARAPASVRELRLAEPDDEDWGLSILISRIEPTPDQLTRLLDLALDSCGGIGMLIAGDQETADGRMAPTALQVAPDPHADDGIVANVIPLQATVRPRALSEAEYDAIATLFTVAADLGDVAADEVPYDYYGAPPWIPQAAASRPDSAAADVRWQGEADDEPDGAPDHDYRPGAVLAGPALPAAASWPLDGRSQAGAHARRLEVRILGAFVITGAAEQLLPKQAELVLALALAAPAGLSNSALRALLGADPDHPKPSDAVRQLITRTRRRLGLASDGHEYIVHAGNGQYQLHPEASLDWTRFRELVASGQADDLRAAIGLIRGQPFTGSYFWWIDIPLVETVRAEIVDAAEALAEWELATGSARAAARAARAGLLAEAAAEQLWRAVMRAEHAAGNLAGVAEAWRRCLGAIEDVAPEGEPHPDTAALYRQLTASAHAPVR